MLKIVDIFYSVQGEGAFIGVPSIFIRLHGCNLACGFCDEPLHKGSYERLDFDAVWGRICGFASRQVVITGGEPSLYDLNPFIDFLQAKGCFVCVESNGYDFSHISHANWVTYSPKDWDCMHEKGFDEVKFIVSHDSNMEKIVQFESKVPLYIQPQNDAHTTNAQNMAFCIEFVKAYPRFRLSPQLHKLLGVE